MPPRRGKRKAVLAAEKSAKRAKGETDLPFGSKWSEVGAKGDAPFPPMYLLLPEKENGNESIMSFDIDYTIIATKSGRIFPTGPKDWKWLYPCVPKKLQSLHQEGKRVVFFTNQKGIEKNHTTPGDVMQKMEDIISELGIPVTVCISTGVNHYRKPSTVMWDYFVKNCNGGKKVNLKKCIYVGDAAGREKDWMPGKPKDFSCYDRMFAANCGVKFQTPEEFFLGEKPTNKWTWRVADPSKYLKKGSGKKTYHSKTQEVVVMVGCPASGKSTLRKNYLEPHGYVTVNRDTLGTMSKCLKAMTEALENGKSVVIDNTNPSKAARGDFLDVAKEAGVACRCFLLETPLEMAKHLNYVRQNMTKGEVRRIPDVAYGMYKKKFQAPEPSEGFTEILKIQFEVEFDGPEHEKLFNQWTED